MSTKFFAVKVPLAGEKKIVAGLPGCAQALVLAQLAETRRVIVLTKDAGTTLRLLEQLRSIMEPSLVHHLAGWEVLPYDTNSPPRAAVSERVATFANLNQGHNGIYVGAAVDALLPCIPPQLLAGRALTLHVGDKINLAKFAAKLAGAGTVSTDRVRNPGEFALYGGQLDLYPGGEHQPVRIIVDDDAITQIRTFDPSTQLSINKVEQFKVLPAREYFLDDDTIERFRQAWNEKFSPLLSNDLYERISSGMEAQGAEFFLPLFYGQRSYLFDYLNRRDVLWVHAGITESLADFVKLAEERRSSAQSYDLAALPFAEVFLTQAEFADKLAAQPVLELANAAPDPDIDLGARPLPELAVKKSAQQPYARLAKWLSQQSGRIVFPWATTTRRQHLSAAISATGSQPGFANQLYERTHGHFLFEGALSGGFVHEQAKFAVVTDAEIHGFVPAPRSLRRASAGDVSQLAEFVPGMLVIHEEHGIARYLGLETITNDDFEAEFVALEFANEVKLYVAVADCNLITRYRQVTPDEQVQLHVLGGKRWQKQRSKAMQVAADTAAELLELYAKRERAKHRPPAQFSEQDYATFCAAFPYAETVDQVKVTAEVVADLTATQPMDRLVVGDVGFGKTEIALRAAWVVWASGQQVAVITPTTLLAEQMFANFTERFTGTTAEIVSLSSLNSPGQQSSAKEQLSQGHADIVVGTHALLAKTIKFKQLGLVIIDEEHRFGVRQKERLRQLRANVDILALSATPIPRSLSMALEGLRDMSTLATPPEDRLSVRTIVCRDEDSIMREALTREATRGGQSFVVHHRIASINAMTDRVKYLLPGATVATLHGQEPPGRLDEVMRQYYAGTIDVLVCTTIIESGIDVPNANTMIVPRADYYGLAQLHQLRGRVGRSARQAYAYFLTPLDLREHKQAKARLETLAESSFLGGGHHIAMRDLEIRGAGEILGAAQSGMVETVGVETFRHMLAQAMRSATGKEVAPSCQVDFGNAARLPADYCANPVERMRMYRRLAACTDDEAILSLRDEMADRFGSLPLQARLLVDCHRLRFRAQSLGVNKVEATAASLRFSFVEQPACASQIIALTAARNDCHLSPTQVLRVANEANLPEQMVLANEICAALAA